MGQSALPQLLDEFLLRLIETWSFREDGRQGVASCSAVSTKLDDLLAFVLVPGQSHWRG